MKLNCHHFQKNKKMDIFEFYKNYKITFIFPKPMKNKRFKPQESFKTKNKI